MDRMELFERCVLGDREAQGLLYTTYRDGMRRVVARVLGAVPEVDDVLHDGFLIIFANIGKVRDPESLPAWMATVMRRLAVKVRNDSNAVRLVDFSDEVNSIPSSEDEEEPASLGWDKLSELIDRLPAGYKRVFRLAVLEEMPHKEIGKLLGINEKSSSSQLFRAKRLLRNFIIEYRNALVAFVALFTVGTIVITLLTNRDQRPDGIAQKSDVTPTRRKIASPATSSLSVPTVAANNRQLLANVKTDKPTVEPAVKPIVETIAETPDSTYYAALTEPTDTTSNHPVRIDTVADNQNNFELIADVPEKRHGWQFGASTEGSYGNNSANSGLMLIPSDQSSNDPWIETEVHRSVRWHMPVVAQVDFAYKFNERWSLSAGLRYTYLRGDSLTTSEFQRRKAEMKIHCIGIPIKATYRMLNYKKVSLYLTGGIGIDIPVYGDKRVYDTGLDYSEFRSWKESLNSSVQFSTDIGIGFEWNFTKHAGLFAEPSFRYYIPTTGGSPTIWREHTCVFTVPVGIRFSW